MPVIVTETPSRPIAQDPPRKRWTRAEVSTLEALGAFDQQHLELIEGELINKMGKNRPHTHVLVFLHEWLRQVFGFRYVNSETPIDVAPQDNHTNKPEPDLIVLSTSYTASWTATPQPQDLRLVVEVSDTSLDFDLGVKAELYARASIVEYWVLDIQGRRLVVHRDQQAGKYQSVVAYNEHESVAPLAAPESFFHVGQVFPE